MPEDHFPESPSDIRQALETASQGPETLQAEGMPPVADTLAHGKSCPLLGIRFALARCGLMAEKYPWQTTAALAATIGCGWLCSYFGFTLLGALVLFAIYADD